MTFGWCWDLAHLFGGPDFLDYLSSLDVVAFVAVRIREVKFEAMLANRHGHSEASM